VVNVTVLSSSRLLLPEGNYELDPDGLLPFSSGSGFVWDPEGHIVTNNHVVEGAEEVQITFSDGTVAVAEVVGVDPDSDLAVLRIDPLGYDLVPVRRGQMEDVAVGMRVAAIGNPFRLEGTLTSGIVSAIGRSIPARDNFSIPDSIQTDAAINPGNSGGPLLNEQGEVIGVNAQIRSEGGSNSGVGFAIPINIVERVVPALITDGEYQHSYMGVSGGTLSPICAEELGVPHELRGAIVGQVLPDSPAERAGLRAGEEPTETHYPSICPLQRGGDIILAINDQPVTKFDDVLAYLQRTTSPGDTVTLTIWRNGETVQLDLTLAARPSSL
jgi:2-alkenal reductase